MISPKNILDLIIDTYKVDITEKHRKGNNAQLKSIYFYLCTTYCNSVVYSYEDIGLLVGVRHSNVMQMARRAADKINVSGWNYFNEALKKLTFLIEENYSESQDYLDHIELDSYDVLTLKRRVKNQEIRNRDKDYRIQKLNREVKKLNLIIKKTNN